MLSSLYPSILSYSRGVSMFTFFFLFVIFFIMVLFPSNSFSQQFGRETGYPVPRFISLRSDEVNVRSGPGLTYPIKWVFVKKGFPLEVIAEYEDWRKVRDIQNDEGWVHKVMLSGKRTAYIKANNRNIFGEANFDSKINAIIDKGVIVDVESCDSKFCEVEVQGINGYIDIDSLWGVYRGESFK